MRIGVLLTMVLLGTAAAGTSRAENRMSWGQLKSGGPEASVDAEGVSLHVAQTAVRVARFHSPIPLRGAVKVRSLDEAGYPGALGVAAVGESGVLLAFLIAPDGTLEEAMSYEPANGVLRDLRSGMEIPAEDLPEDLGGLFGAADEKTKGTSLICRRLWKAMKVGGVFLKKASPYIGIFLLLVELLQDCAGNEASPQDAGGGPDSTGADPDTTGNGNGGNGP